MKKVTRSQFAVLRVVGIMVGINVDIIPQQENWFAHTLSRFDLTNDQTRQLHEELRSPPPLNAVLYEVEPEDWRQLGQLLKLAMLIDGKVDPKEEDLLKDIIELQKPVEDPAATLAKFSAEMNERATFWSELEDFGYRLRARARVRFYF